MTAPAAVSTSTALPISVITPALGTCPAIAGPTTGSVLPGAMHGLRAHVAGSSRLVRACIAHAWPAPAAGWTATLSRPQSVAFGRWSQV